MITMQIGICWPQGTSSWMSEHNSYTHVHTVDGIFDAETTHQSCSSVDYCNLEKFRVEFFMQ